MLGASPNSGRYSWKAVQSLRSHGHEVVAVGNREGTIGDVEIHTDLPAAKDVDTVTLYMNAGRQRAFHDYILGLSPKRLIFNPGAENDELADLAGKKGIETVEGCTLVMLSIGNY